MLEISGSHPPVPGGAACPAGLDWTVSQLLALFLRTGDKAADEVSLLAALWVLESANDSRRCAASTVLVRYTKLVGAFFPEVATALCNNWAAAFEAMRSELVASQLALLTRLRWRVHLTLETAEAGKPAAPSRAAGGAAGGCSLAAEIKFGSCGRVAGGKAAACSRPVRGLAGSKRGRASLDDLEALLASIRAELRGSMQSMAAVLKERAALLRRALLGQAIKRGLCPPCAAEAKRRRTQ
ncbi:hypothetical protein COHA_008114 [Chlorella ohadii]|uniref:Uncharacterized protein n=1 Tax=Chlorella ohadii TaxID=2649997 RepID=A0AAD5DJH2_9CHLO|nr:hypothetical protein COHA_008114 [Chlorella ohadii]